MIMNWNVNFLSVIIAAVATIILGTLWYGPIFGKYWIKLMGFTSKQIEEGKKKGMTGHYIAALLGSFVMVFALSMLMQALSVTTIGAAWALSIIIWIGFYLTLTLGGVLWEGKSLQLYVFNNLYNLVQLLVVSAIIIAMQ